MDEYWLLNEAEFSAEQRKKLAKKGQALPDGSFPIRNRSDLQNAVQAFGRAKNKSATKAHIIKRARALKALDDLPDDWREAIAEAEQSLDEQSSAVRQAWRELVKSPLDPYGENSWPREVYSDHIIVRVGEDLYRVDYSEGDDGITFDRENAKKVEMQYVAVEALADIDGSAFFVRPIAEAGEQEPSGSQWEVVIIRAGKSKNGRRYSEKVLQEAVPLFEGARVLARSDEDHIAGKNKSVEKIVGWLSEVNYARKAVRGMLNVLESAVWLRTMLLDAWKRGKKDLAGLSIVGDGRGKVITEAGQKVLDVQAITAISSVDIVMDPAAGGELVKLVAAVGKEESDVDPKLIAALKEAEATVVRALLKPLSEEDVSAIMEAHPELKDKITEALALKDPAPTPEKPEPVAEATADPPTEDADLIPVAMARFVVREALAETKLPDRVKARIVKQYGSREFKETELTEAISDEIALWADLEKDKVVPSMGEPRSPEVGIEEAQKAKAALDGFFAREDVELDGVKVPRYRSFREAYVDLTGDTEISGRLPRRPSGKLGISEANGGRFQLRLHAFGSGTEGKDIELSEAIISTTFGEMLGDSIARQALREYRQANLEIWRPLVDIVPARDFRTQHRMRMGGYGNLPAVAEAANYVALTSPADEEATYAVTKRGGLESITLETIANDDVGVVRRIPVKLGRSAAQTLHEFVLQFLNANPTIYDSVALFAAGHNNLGSAALSVTSLSAARLRMQKQADMSNSKRIGLTPSWLWVPLELQQIAYELTQSDKKPGTADNDANYVRDMNLNYQVVPYWTDTNNWYLTADSGQTPLIELAFFGGEEPELFVQDNPNVGTMFDADKLTWKIRHVYGGAVMDFRGFDGSIVA